jgi:hypothetical protein
MAGIPTSVRGYLSKDDLEQLANINITDDTEADDVISQAEEIVDEYVGFHQFPLKGKSQPLNPPRSSR